MPEPTHKLFLDDSGNKDYDENGRYGNKSGRTLYFVFGGLLISPLDASLVDYSLRTLKRDTFGTQEVEIKANWLKRREERTKRYLEAYGITEAKLDDFTEAVYEVIDETNCQLIACAVNKAQVQQQYRGNLHHASSIAYDCVLQRVQREMADCGGEAHVTIDNMTGATPAGNQHLDNLRRQHQLFRKYGSTLQRNMAFNNIRRLAFRDSKQDERLQLADLVAHAVYRHFVDYGEDWARWTPERPSYRYFLRMANKFRNPEGRVQGYGVVKFPKDS